MKGILFHDLPIYKDIHGEYCSTTMTNEIFSRYLQDVNELVAAMRVYRIDTSYEEAHYEKICVPGLRFLDLPNLNSLRGLLFHMRKVWNLFRHEMQQADLVFIRGGTIAMLGTTVARKLCKPYFIECGGCAWDAYWNHSLLGKLLAPYMEYRQRQDIKHASFASYVTQSWLQEKYPTNGMAVGISGVNRLKLDEEILQRRIEKIRDRNRESEIVIGTTAGINVRYKGQQYVIEAIAKLKALGLVFRYELVGGGSSAYLQKIAEKYGVQDQVIFRGELTHDEVLLWLDNLDIYVQPSKTEGLPRALVEALSRACPAIGSNLGGIKELLEEEAIFPVANIDMLAERLMWFAKNDLQEIAVRNFEKAKQFDTALLNEKRQAFFASYAQFIHTKQMENN